MRHGRSLANEQGLIISNPADGVLDKYGLSATGREQAEASARNSPLTSETLIYSSDFSRARQTAEIIKQIIGANDVTSTEALRERFFGDWDKTSHENFEKVYEVDSQLVDTHQNNVEPLSSVIGRILELIKEIEKNHSGKTVLLVSHGDPLQILQTSFEGQDLTKHRDLPYIKTAEIRQIA